MQRSIGNQAYGSYLQAQTPHLLQRQPNDQQEKIDVLLQLTEGESINPGVLEMARGATILRIMSLDDMVEQLSALTSPIDHLLIVSHATDGADLEFDDGSTKKDVSPSEIATAVKDIFPEKGGPEVVDFRGCLIGISPSGMEEIRQALQASSAIGGNCYMIWEAHGPIEIGHDITEKDDVTDDIRPVFEEQLPLLADLFGDAKACILDNSEEGYFRAGGTLWPIGRIPPGRRHGTILQSATTTSPKKRQT